MRTDAHKIIEEIEAKAYEAGHQDGHVKGYREGWEAAKLAANKALEVPSIKSSTSSKANGATNPFRAGTASANVYSFIKNSPGKRGVEIIKALGIGTKIGRTALWRLKKDGIAVNENGWRLL